MNEGDIISTESIDYHWRSYIATYDYIFIKQEYMPDSNLHWLPRELCPDPHCGDIGQHVYTIDGVTIHYCPYCYTHYTIRYSQHYRNKEDSPKYKKYGG
jgi:hypothetical protein